MLIQSTWFSFSFTIDATLTTYVSRDTFLGKFLAFWHIAFSILPPFHKHQHFLSKLHRCCKMTENDFEVIEVKLQLELN